MPALDGRLLRSAGLELVSSSGLAIAARAGQSSGSCLFDLTHMELKGDRLISASRDAVWQALNDPAVLKECILGCDSLEQVSDTEFNATVTAKFGPVKAKFKAVINLQDLNPPESYRLVGEGKGGVAGFAKGGATVALSEQGANETKLTYDADMQVGGKLAQVGSRLVSGTTTKIVNEFFTRFEKQLNESAAD